jgi:hypothetical protein
MQNNEKELLKNEVSRTYQAHWELAFPDHPQCEILEDWRFDLIETDPYYVGIAGSVLAGSWNAAINFSHIEKLALEFNQCSTENDRKSYDECREYLTSLTKMCEALKRYKGIV